MKKKWLLFTIVLIVIIITSLSVLSGCAKTDLLKVANSDNMFAYENLDEAKKDWNLVYSGKSENSIFSFAENGLTMNVDGYAYASQEIKLKPNAYYKVSYNYEISEPLEGTTENPLYSIGLFIGFEEDPNFNVTHEKRTNHWGVERKTDPKDPVVFYFKSDRSRVYNLKIALGTKDMPVKGSATLNNLKMEKVPETVAKAEGAYLYNLKSTIFGRASVDNIVYIVLGCLSIFVIGYIVYILKSRDLAFETKKSKNKFYNTLQNNKAVAPVMLISITLLIRVLILAIQSGLAAQKSITESLFGFNLEQLAYQGQWIAKHGTVYFLKNNLSSTFLPIPLYLASLAGVIGNTSAASAEIITVSLLKLFAIFADVGTVLLIYHMMAKRQGNASALIMSLCYSLMPVMFLSSGAGWSITASFASFTLVAAFLFMLEKNYMLSSTMYFLSCMTSVAALLFIPAFILYAGVYIAFSIRDRKTKESVLSIALFIGFFFIFYLITLPFSLDFIRKGQAMHAFSHFISIVKGKNVYTLNAFNFQGLLKNNFVEITSQSTLVSILFVIFLLIIVAILYVKSKNRLQLIILTSGFSIMAWTFLNRMTPEALILLLPAIFIGAVLYNDKRLYFVFLLYTLTAYINLSYVHLIVGYDASGIIHIDYSKTPIMYVIGSFNLLFVIYYIVVLYDILISKKLSVIKPIEMKYVDHVKFQTKKITNNLKLFAAKINVYFSALALERKQRKAEKVEQKEKEKIKNNIEEDKENE